MTTEFTRNLLRVALAQICQNLGWSSVHSTPMELLTDVLERYITSLGRYSHRYSEQFGRVEPNLDDLGLAFQELGVNLSELKDFVKQVDPLPFAFDVPRFPVRRESLLTFPKPNSRELYEREEHVHDHMPTMHPGWDEEIMALDSEGGEGVAADGGEKRAVTTPSDDEPASKRLRSRVYPEEAAPSRYEMRNVLISDSGDIIGQGKLPEPNAPPLPTPTTPMVKPAFFQTPPLPKITDNVPSPKGGGENNVVAKEEVKVEVKTEPIDVPKSPRTESKPPKSPKGGLGTAQTQKPVVTTVAEKKKKPGRPFKKSPKSSGIVAKSPIGRPAKSPGRPPKSPGRPPKSPGRPPKSPGRPPKSPFQSPARSPGRPPKSPGTKSPVRSPMSSPLSPKSPGAVGRGRSPGRPPKSPGRVGRPPKSPGRGRPPKSPGRPPGSKKDVSIPISQYFLTGEPPIGVPTKAQLKQQPIQSPPWSKKTSSKSHKQSDSIQKLDFNTPFSETDVPPGVTVETVEVITTTEKSPARPKSEKLKKPTASIDETIAAVLKQGEMEEGAEEEARLRREAAAEAQRAKEEKLRQQILQQQDVKPEPTEEKAKGLSEMSGRVTPDWIRQQAAEMDKLRAEDKRKSLTEANTAPVVPDVHADSPREKSKSKKEKKKDRERRKHKDTESDKERQLKKEKRLEEKLREKLLEASQSSSSPERAAPSSDKTETIPSLRIGIGKEFTIKSVTEDSDKETKKGKKKKKKKEKERDLEDKEKIRKKKDKDKIKREDEESVPKLKFTFGGQGKVFITPNESPRESPKRDIPKLVIKQREDSPEKRVFTKVSLPSRSPSVSPARSVSPPRKSSPPPRTRSPPLKARSPLSPMRFTPSPESNPKTPSMGSPFHIPSPMRSRSPSPTKPISPPERSLSPAKTPSLTAPSPRSSPSPPPPKGVVETVGDALPPPPPSAKSGNKRAVFAETQGTIIGENGEIIWICPACTLADDGSPMIGCDVCDDWYHWDCVGITEEPPEDESWYCPKHRSSEPSRKPSTRGSGRGRGRGRGRKKKS